MTKKQLENYITKIRPKADAYDRICETLGIKNDILGYIQKLKVSQVEKPVILEKCGKEFEDFRDYILQKEKEGKIVISTYEGFMEADLDKIINQPTEGLLYDLNRNRETILTFIKEQKWVNDFACMKVIEKLKALLSK